MSDISHSDFDLIPARRAETKWSYRRLFLMLAGISCISWAAIIIACATFFR